MEQRPRRLIVGVSGASGVVLSQYLLSELKRGGHEVHLIVSEGARRTWALEVGSSIESLYALATQVYAPTQMDAVLASGSFVTDGMIVCPCSMKTLAAIVHGYADTLLVRAVDVCLKEGRKVVLVPREMPFGIIHLRNLLLAAELRMSIVCPMLTCYNGGQTLQAQMTHVIGKVLMQFGLETEGFVAWKGAQEGC